MKQHIKQKGFSPIVIVIIFAAIFVVAGAGYYFSTTNKNGQIAEKEIVQDKVGPTPTPISIPTPTPIPTVNPTNTAIPTPTTIPTSITTIKTQELAEAGFRVSFPGNYSIATSDEPHRRGSFVSYDFQQEGNYKPPALSLDELQFFSEDSIRSFTSNCGDMPCFMGSYPDLTRYSGQKTALAQSKNYGNFKLQIFNDRNWFVSNIGCMGSQCIIREYTTFFGNTEIDVWIMMPSKAEERAADMLFSQLKIEQYQK